jgi:hypothetical protein
MFFKILLLQIASLCLLIGVCTHYGHPRAAQDMTQYKHKTEAEIASMTPSQRVDDYADEQAFHKYDISDYQSDSIVKYIRRDRLAAIPRIIEILDEYDPTTATRRGEHKGERFDAMWTLLDDLDNKVVRLRVSGEGRQAIDALERAIGRMRAAGYGRRDQHEWAEHGRVESAEATLNDAKGINSADEAIQDTFWVKYKVKISDKVLSEFSTFLLARDPTYPSWSETDLIKDSSRLNEAGNPAQVYVFLEPERFHQAYLEFRKVKH